DTERSGDDRAQILVRVVSDGFTQIRGTSDVTDRRLRIDQGEAEHYPKRFPHGVASARFEPRGDHVIETMLRKMFDSNRREQIARCCCFSRCFLQIAT